MGDIIYLLLSILLKSVLSIIGWLYLLVRFCDLEKMKKEVYEQYKGAYSNAGKRVGLNILVAAGLVTIVAVWILGIYSIIRS